MFVTKSGFNIAFLPAELGGSDNTADQALLQSGGVSFSTNAKDTKGIHGADTRTKFKVTKSASEMGSSVSGEDRKAVLRTKSSHIKAFSDNGKKTKTEAAKIGSKLFGNTVDHNDVDGWVQVTPKKADTLEDTVSIRSNPSALTHWLTTLFRMESRIFFRRRLSTSPTPTTRESRTPRPTNSATECLLPWLVPVLGTLPAAEPPDPEASARDWGNT